MMQKPQLANNEIYHVYNRGVEKRKIFLEEADYLRFIHDIFEFNNSIPAQRFYQSSGVGLPKIERGEPRKFLVDILAFCIMPNHFHLMLKQKVDNGITKFMHKFGTGYANYFNLKYKRSGTLFQGKYKAVHIQRDAHFIYLPFYIHFNPLDIAAPEWRDGKINNISEVIKFLESYRWSSYLDYIGKKNFPSVTQREFLMDFFGGPEQYKRDAMEWLKEMNLSEIKDIILE